MSRRIPRHPLVHHVSEGVHEVLVDRSTPYGNPFRPGPFESRTDCIARYERWLLSQPELVARVRAELRSKRLGCHCRPKCCHADVLARIANEPG